MHHMIVTYLAYVIRVNEACKSWGGRPVVSYPQIPPKISIWTVASMYAKHRQEISIDNRTEQLHSQSPSITPHKM